MVLKLASEQKSFETFLGTYWVHRNQYKGQNPPCQKYQGFDTDLGCPQ